MPKGDRLLLKADIEDGFARIANLFLEALAVSNLSGLEKSIILLTWRKTYGWRKNGRTLKEREITLDEWCDWLGVKKPNACRALARLESHNVLARRYNAKTKASIYSVNTHISEWNGGCIDIKRLSKMITVIQNDNCYPKRQRPLSKMITTIIQNDNPSISNSGMPKESIKEIVKDNIVVRGGKSIKKPSANTYEIPINDKENIRRAQAMIENDPKLAKACEFYTKNISVNLTPMVADILKDITNQYDIDWIEEAFKQAVMNNAPKLSYVQACLENWKRIGHISRKPSQNRSYGDKRQPVRDTASTEELKASWGV